MSCGWNCSLPGLLGCMHRKSGAEQQPLLSCHRGCPVTSRLMLLPSWPPAMMAVRGTVSQNLPSPLCPVALGFLFSFHGDRKRSLDSSGSGGACFLVVQLRGSYFDVITLCCCWYPGLICGVLIGYRGLVYFSYICWYLLCDWVCGQFLRMFCESLRTNKYSFVFEWNLL